VKAAGTGCAPEPFNRPRSNVGCCLRVPGASRYHLGVRCRTYKNTDLIVSEVGFGLWTISTGWWGNFTEGEAIDLMHKAFDLGITLVDVADT
jgi:hypothetical protein